jgi:hypothetical protein
MKARLATMAPWCREIVLPASVLVVLAGLGFTNSGATRVAPVIDRIAPSLAADVKFAGRVEDDKPQTAIASADFVKTANALAVIATATPVAQEPAVTTASIDSAEATQPTKPVVVASADPTASIAPAAEASADPAPVTEAPKPVVVAALTDSAEVLAPATTPEQAAEASTGDGKANDAKPRVDTAAVLDECYVIDTCADRYLWALYERTRKEDTVKEKTQREVTIKRKGKTVTVTRTVSRVVDEDFGWKDPKAADHAGMTITDYVIGGMDHDFKLRLFRLLLAAEQAGLSPGITSAFRDNYRQSIASGLKAADDRSFHGGSLRGGYGHGLAADIVSVNGATRALRQASSEVLWTWVDKHGKDYGMGRPYHDRDPPHVGPIDGSEYVSRHAGGRSRHAAASRARRTAVANASQAAAERVRTANASAR